jgi:hypothetical protein
MKRAVPSARQIRVAQALSGDAGQQPPTITAVQRHTRPQSAMPGNQQGAPCKRTVSGSNPLTGSDVTRQNAHEISVADLAC